MQRKLILLQIVGETGLYLHAQMDGTIKQGELLEEIAQAKC